jgi:hypothetical protein
MPTELPPLPPALEKEVFRIKADASLATPHYEVLEWLGDSGRVRFAEAQMA